MRLRSFVLGAVPMLSVIVIGTAWRAPAAPADELAAIVKVFVGLPQPADWSGLEQLPGVRWAPLPPASLANCAPDGGCFARQGTVNVGGKPMVVLATGARMMAMHVYFRNGGAPLGKAAVLSALQAASITTVLARCPVRGSRGTSNWYRLSGAAVAATFLAVQAPNAAGIGEGFVLSSGNQLPQLQPNQRALYSEQCAPGAAQRPVSTVLPHEAVAATVVALLLPSTRVAYDWAALAALPTGITWLSDGPTLGDLSFRGDRNPFNRTGTVTYAGREFSVQASGTPSQVKVIYLDEVQLHPRGEHMLGVVYQKGIAVQLTRCGPVYTESTNNWYSLSSPRTRPAMIRQSIRYDGKQVQDAYELRLDGTLPARDPRDRNPGVNGCQ